MSAVRMQVNPHTGNYNVTREEVRDAYLAQRDVELVRFDNTLTHAGQAYVARMRARAVCPHDDVEGDDNVPTTYTCRDCGDVWNGGAE